MYNLEVSLLLSGLLVLIPSLVFRVFFLGGPIIAFVNIFRLDGKNWKKDAIEGSKAIRNLEIPGLNYFVKVQLLYGFFPYIILALSMVFFDTSNIMMNQLDPVLLGMCIMGFIIWMIGDIFRSIKISRELDNIVSETNSARANFGNALTGIRYYANIKSGVKRLAVNASVKVAAKIAGEHSRSDESSSSKRGILSMVMQGVEDVLTTPEKLLSHASDKVQEQYDEKLKQHFSKYAEQEFKFSLIFRQILWGIIPAVVIVLIAIFNS